MPQFKEDFGPFVLLSASGAELTNEVVLTKGFWDHNRHVKVNLLSVQCINGHYLRERVSLKNTENQVFASYTVSSPEKASWRNFLQSQFFL